MLREKLDKMIKAKEAEIESLKKRSAEATEVAELRSINEDIDKVIDELKALKDMYGEAEKPVEGGDNTPSEGDNGNRSFTVAATLETRKDNAKMENNEMKARIAFRNFIANGNREELRSAAGNTTGADNVSTVIPQNLIDRIMEKIESVGTIYNLVTKTAFPVGQTIPREATKPVATWVGYNSTTPSSSTSGEGNGSTPVKGVTLDTAIVFANFKLRCEVAMTEEVAQMALPAFEALFVKNVSAAMLRAIEFAIVDGGGQGMPKGILAETAPSGQAIEVAAGANNKLTYKLLCDAEAAIPQEYEAGAKWCMTKKTFMGFVGMTDSNGQPIARINYGVSGKPERTLLGREVVIYVPQSGSQLGNYADTVSADTLFAFIFDFADYVLNNNYDLGIQHKKDWDNEDHRTKAVSAYDGKVIDKGSLVTLTKKH